MNGNIYLSVMSIRNLFKPKNVVLFGIDFGFPYLNSIAYEYFTLLLLVHAVTSGYIFS